MGKEQLTSLILVPRKIMKQALRDSFQGGILSLFSALVKLQLGYHVQFGAPSTKKDMDLLEQGVSEVVGGLERDV